MSNDKIFCGSGKERKFDNGGSIIGITIDLETIYQVWQKYGFINRSGRRMIRLDVSTKRQVDQYNNTHSVSVNTWKPDNQGQQGFSSNQSSFNSQGVVNNAQNITNKSLDQYREDLPPEEIF